ncbi:hypothetical protein [Clostridium thermobutyricum]|uniref:hypothetical protein n=1 Tax=Clostridium thermobutyricum TaxID=29372 RepID=UPI002942BC07|nr:hypothetical protein [Clostridium thermobutyricum]
MEVKNIISKRTSENAYLYINGVEDISIPIGIRYHIKENDIKKLDEKSNNNKKGYAFCFGKIIKGSMGKIQIEAKDTKLEYIFINKNNIKALFR